MTKWGLLVSGIGIGDPPRRRRSKGERIGCNLEGIGGAVRDWIACEPMGGGDAGCMPVGAMARAWIE